MHAPSTLTPLAGALASLLALAACAAGTDTEAGAQQWAAAPSASTQQPQAVLPDGFPVTLELAITPEEISQGLMFRPSLPEDRGMLFVLGVERVPNFWMKDTLVALDLVFLDSRGEVVDLIENAQPCKIDPCPRYIPRVAAAAVLELNAGAAGRHDVDVGARLEFVRVEGYPSAEAADG